MNIQSLTVDDVFSVGFIILIILLIVACFVIPYVVNHLGAPIKSKTLAIIKKNIDWERIAKQGKYSVTFELNVVFIDGVFKAVEYVDGGCPKDLTGFYSRSDRSFGDILSPPLDIGIAQLIPCSRLTKKGEQKFLVEVTCIIVNGSIQNYFFGSWFDNSE